MDGADRQILFQFFGRYFHQDWAVDDPDWASVVRRYARDVGPVQAGHTSRLVRGLIAENRSEDVVASVLDGLGCYFCPPGTGLTYQTWLAELVKALVDQ